MTGGICPQCRNDTTIIPLESLEMTRICITEQCVIPKVCATCGLPTSRVVTFKRRRPSPQNDDDSSVIWYLGFGIIGLLFSALFRRANSSRVRIQVPHCRQCHAEKPLEPRSVAFDELLMDFVVHREFAKQFDAVNGL